MIMKSEKPLINKDYLLFKTPGKGGWTFIEIPEIPMPKTSFGMLKVKGFIDNYELSGIHLMPIGNGYIGLSVNAEIRKKIKKQAGDTVHLILFEDKTTEVIPDEFLLCLEYEEEALERFKTYTNGQKKAFIDWIYAAKTEQTQAERIAKVITMILAGEKLY